MDIICARHGNTFAPGERVVFVGAKEDVPLAPAGEEQARRLAAALREAGVKPAVVLCGPLQRTRRYADLVAAELRLAMQPVVDERLTEIDYGDWAGLTNEEISSQLDQGEDLRLWNEAGVWPARANWGGSEAGVKSRVAAFLQVLQRELPGEAVLVVSSNGILRYFAIAAAGAEARSDARFPFKMRTGNFGIIRDTGDKYVIVSWDVTPGGSP